MTAQEQEYRTIPLTQNQSTIVDASQYHALSKFEWYAKWDISINSFYAVRNSERLPNGNQRPISMAREILGLKFGDRRQADHANHDTLDNRRSNLRIVSASQNAINRRQRTAKSGFRGVYFRCGKWEARLVVAGKRIVLGRFYDKQKAINARAEGEIVYHREFIP